MSREERKLRNARIVEERNKEREASRLLPRFTAHTYGTIGGFGEKRLGFVGVTNTVGFRQNFSRKFGMQLRLGVGVQYIGIYESEENPSSNGQLRYHSDSATVTDVFTEVTPFFGPFWRFYFGPIFWCAYNDFSERKLTAGTTVVLLEDESFHGWGIDMGFLFLRRDALDVNWRVKSTFDDRMPFRLEVGIGYHFM
jgi:hypothetical protein